MAPGRGRLILVPGNSDVTRDQRSLWSLGRAMFRLMKWSQASDPSREAAKE